MSGLRWVAAEYATDANPRRLVRSDEGSWRDVSLSVLGWCNRAREARDAAGWRDDRMDQERAAIGSEISHADARQPVHTFGGTMLSWEIVRRPEGQYLPVPVDQLAAWWRREPLRALELDPSGEARVVRWLYGRRDTMRAVQLDTYRDDPEVARALVALRAAQWIARDLSSVRADLDRAGQSRLDWSIGWADRLLDGGADAAMITQRAGVLRQSLSAAQGVR